MGRQTSSRASIGARDDEPTSIIAARRQFEARDPDLIEMNLPRGAGRAIIDTDEAELHSHDVPREPEMPRLIAKAAVVNAAVKPGPSPVAKAAVVGAAVKPGPSPVAKAAVIGAAVTPGPSPVAKAAIVGAAVTPGRRRR